MYVYIYAYVSVFECVGECIWSVRVLWENTYIICVCVALLVFYPEATYLERFDFLLWIYVYIYIHIYICIRIYVCVYVCVCISLRVCVFVCVCVRIYISSIAGTRAWTPTKSLDTSTTTPQKWKKDFALPSFWLFRTHTGKQIAGTYIYKDNSTHTHLILNVDFLSADKVAIVLCLFWIE